MTTRPDAPRRPAGAAIRPDGKPNLTLVRRGSDATTSDVGSKGRRAQRRILDAALVAFGERGYDQCNVARITELAGCSRGSFYQYFSGKEDVFRRLIGDAFAELIAASASAGAIGPGIEGQRALTEWFRAYGVTHERHRAVFAAFHGTASSEPSLILAAHEWSARVNDALRGQLGAVAAPGYVAGLALRLMPITALIAYDIANLLPHGKPPLTIPADRLAEALANVFHRVLFGVQPDVNTTARRRKVLFDDDDAVIPRVAEPDDWSESREVILDAALRAFTERGFHGTRIDDIADQAGMSHGALYHYFPTKRELFRLVGARGGLSFVAMFDELASIDPADPRCREQLLAWVREFALTHAEVASLMRVWVDALANGPELGRDSGAVIKMICMRIIRMLKRRVGGDPHAESLLLLALLTAMDLSKQDADTVTRCADLLTRGLLAVD